jgi:hypothetical protein
MIESSIAALALATALMSGAAEPKSEAPRTNAAPTKASE